jgi:hypothetical protein
MLTTGANSRKNKKKKKTEKNKQTLMQLHWQERCEPAHMGEALILPIEAKHSASQYLFEG